MCAVCRGRGEVEAGITGGFVATSSPDENGVCAGYPTRVDANPHALDKDGTMWLLDQNPLVALWGIAVCAECRGTGLLKEKFDAKLNQ